MNLVGPVSPGTKQPTRKEDPRSAHTRSTFQPQNSTSQSNQLVLTVAPTARVPCQSLPIHPSSCHHDRVFDMQIVITTRLSHPMPFVPTQTLCACELSIYGLLALAALADLAQRQKNLLKELCLKKSTENSVSFLTCNGQVIVLCRAQESAQRTRKRRVARSEMFLSGLGQGLGRRPTVWQSKRV